MDGNPGRSLLVCLIFLCKNENNNNHFIYFINCHNADRCYEWMMNINLKQFLFQSLFTFELWPGNLRLKIKNEPKENNRRNVSSIHLYINVECWVFWFSQKSTNIVHLCNATLLPYKIYKSKRISSPFDLLWIVLFHFRKKK